MEDKNRPDLEGNEAAGIGGAPAGGTAGQATAAALEGGNKSEIVDAKEGYVPYAAAGAQFTKWFNRRVSEVPNPTVKLGTKTARVETLHDDGRLEVRIEGEGGKDEQQFVAFDPSHLDMLLMKFTAAAR
jgi:hypothetical protein